MHPYGFECLFSCFLLAASVKGDIPSGAVASIPKVTGTLRRLAAHSAYVAPGRLRWRLVDRWLLLRRLDKRIWERRSELVRRITPERHCHLRLEVIHRSGLRVLGRHLEWKMRHCGRLLNIVCLNCVGQKQRARQTSWIWEAIRKVGKLAGLGYCGTIVEMRRELEVDTLRRLI